MLCLSFEFQLQLFENTNLEVYSICIYVFINSLLYGQHVPQGRLLGPYGKTKREQLGCMLEPKDIRRILEMRWQGPIMAKHMFFLLCYFLFSIRFFCFLFFCGIDTIERFPWGPFFGIPVLISLLKSMYILRT